MIFIITKISNGWLIRSTWIEQGQERTEELYFKSKEEASQAYLIWADGGFEEALKWARPTS